MVDITTKRRLVIYYKHQDKYIELRPLLFEQVADFIMDLSRDDHLTSWDVADAIHHAWPSEREAVLLAFRVGSKTYFPLMMPFRRKLAPWIWTKLMRPVIAHLRAAGSGSKLMPYMDDFGYSAATPHVSRPVSLARGMAGRVDASSVFRSLGIDIHKIKGQATEITQLDLLGFSIGTSRRFLLLLPARLREVVGSAVSLLGHATTHRRWLTLRALQRFCGKAVSTAAAVPDAPFHLQALYARFSAGQRRNMRQISSRASADPEWWRGLATFPNVNRALWQQHICGELKIDACGYGWQRLLGRLVPARGFFSADVRDAHINVQEILSMRYTLRSFPHLRGPRVVQLWTDCMVNVHVLNSMR